MAMAACSDENKEPYEAAVAAYNAGDYANAVPMLKALGDYQDAAALLATIKAEKTGVTVEKTTSEGVLISTVEYAFKDGNLIKETITHADGTVTKNYYKYNDINLCTSETLNDVDGGKTINVEGKYMANIASDTVSFAVRVLDIPERHQGTEIFARVEAESGNISE